MIEKNVFELCLFQLINERIRILSCPEFDQFLFNEVDTVIKSIETYLTIISKLA